MKKISRRTLISTAVGSVVGGLMPPVGFSAEGGRRRRGRPNIIVLVTDDHRADAMGCAGNATVQTPNMDALAAAGVRFTNAFVTTSICASSRASIFSGQWTGRHGITDFNTHFTPEAFADTYPMQLKAAGYRVGFIGKYGVGAAKDLPADRFAYWKGFPGQGKYEHTDADGDYKHLTSLMGDQALEFLGGCASDHPFCLSISFKAPHVQDGDPRQFVYDRALADLYKDVSIPAPPPADPKYFDALPPFLRDSESRRRWELRFPDDARRQESVRSYYRLITGVDIAIGRIRGELDRLGFADNTVILFVGDNGFYLGEYGLAGKWFPHELSIRVPMIVYDPRAPKNRRGLAPGQFALNVDMAPTILELAGLRPPASMQGRSLVSILQGRNVAWRDAFFYEHPFEHPTIARSVALRTQRWKYARFTQYDYEWLFDLRNDPDEVNNLANDPQHAETLGRLRRRCERMAQRAKEG